MSRLGVPCQLWYIKCKPETSIARNRKNQSTCSSSYLKIVASKAENLFWKWAIPFNGGIINTDDVEDFASLCLENNKPEYPTQNLVPARQDFAFFILTHERAERQMTLKLLKRSGYTGKWYLLVDDQDRQLGKYKELYGEHVAVFDKETYWQYTDTMRNEYLTNAVVFAKNACFDAARGLGLRYFAMVDDDITSINFKAPKGKKLRTRPARNLNQVCNAICECLSNGAVSCIGFSKEGAFVGGMNDAVKDGLYWRLGQMTFYSVDRRWKFRSLYFEDTMSSLDMQAQGRIAFSTMLIAHATERNKDLDGGMHDQYSSEDAGYVGNCLLLMAHPDKIKLTVKIKNDEPKWGFTRNKDCSCPKVLNMRYRA